MTWRREIGCMVGDKMLAQFLADETGQDLVEYALILAFMALGTVATMKGLATTLGSVFAALGSTLTSAV